MPATAIEALAHLPIRAVKGVGDDWNRTLVARRFLNLGDLATAGPERVAELVADTSSRQPIQIVTVAGLLDLDLPTEDVANALDVSLYRLVGMSPTDLRELARDSGHALSVAESRAVSRLVSVAYTALNVRWLQRISLGDLIAGTIRSR